MDDGRTGVLAERQQAFASHLGVAQEGQGYVLVVGAGFGVGENLGHLLVVRTSELERDVVEGGVGHQRQAFAGHFEHRHAFELANRHVVFGQQTIFGGVALNVECFLEFKFCHNLLL